MHLTDATTAPDNCWTVTATDDTIYEVDSQIFTLTLTLVNTSSLGIMLTNSSAATITVMDDEGIKFSLGPRPSFRFFNYTKYNSAP